MAGNPLKSRPSRPLFIGALVVVTIAVVLPYTPLGSLVGFIPLPLPLLAAIAFLAVAYLLLVQAVKSCFIAGIRCFKLSQLTIPKIELEAPCRSLRFEITGNLSIAIRHFDRFCL